MVPNRMTVVKRRFYNKNRSTTFLCQKKEIAEDVISVSFFNSNNNSGFGIGSSYVPEV